MDMKRFFLYFITIAASGVGWVWWRRKWDEG